MKEKNKGYYIYSIIAVLAGFSLFGYAGYLLYDLIIKLSEKDFSNNTVIQALFTLFITVFIGGYFSKKLELRNLKQIEVYKIRTELSIKIIDYASHLFYNKNDDKAKQILFAEQKKVFLYFDTETNSLLENYLKNIDIENFNELINVFKKNIK